MATTGIVQVSLRPLQPILTALGLAIGPGLAIGLGTLAFPVFLPAMMADLGLNFAQAGSLVSAGAVGALMGILVLMATQAWVSAGLIYRFGILIACAGLLLGGVPRDFSALIGLRVLMGVAGLLLLACGLRLASTIFVYGPDRTTPVLGYIVRLGGASGLLVAALMVPTLLAMLGDRGWSDAWLMAGLVAVVLAPFALWASRRIVSGQPARDEIAPTATTLPILLSYALFSAGMLSALFLLGIEVSASRLHGGAAAAVWATLALAALLAPAFWRSVLVGVPEAWRLACPMALTLVGVLTLFADPAPALLVPSAALLGFGGMWVPTMVAEAVSGGNQSGTVPRAVLMAGTLGEIAGPLAVGVLADETGTLRVSFTAAAITLALAVVAARLAYRQPVAATAALLRALPKA